MQNSPLEKKKEQDEAQKEAGICCLNCSTAPLWVPFGGALEVVLPVLLLSAGGGVLFVWFGILFFEPYY